MAKTTVPGLYIADSAITAAKLNSTLDLTGKTITVATASSGDNDTTVASTAFVQQEIASLVDSSPSALNTLNELAAAIGDDANFSTTITNSIATKLALAGGTMTGDLIINTTGALQIPVGTTAQRPTAATGQFRFNSSTTKAEIYDGSSWSDVGGGVESVNSNTGVVTLDTDDISEGSTNLYFTNARADARIAAATTDDLSEGSTNLYFTTARANSAIDGRLSGSTGVTVSNGAISIGQDVATSTSPTFQNLTLSGTDSIKVPSGTTAQRSGSPANGMLRYNSTNGEFEGYQSGAWGALGGDTTSSVDLYTATGNGSTATYDTGKNPQSENNTWVFIGGVYQPKSTYSYSGTEITLSENLPNGEDLEVITGTVSTYNPTDAILGQFNTTTSNTASYDTSLTTENENNVFVFIDGVYQPKSSYTYSGSTLTLDATPTSGMSLEVLVTRSMNAATVTTGFLADDAVTTAKITDANVTAAKLASSLDLTGKTVTVATASAGDNDTSVASTAFVRQEITALVDSAPAAMDTLNELAAALGDDANFSTTVNASIAAKLPLAGGTLTGDLNFGDNDKAIFGANSDLQIYSNGTDSFIQDSGTGILRLKSNGGRILMETAGGETLAEFINNGNTVLYSNNAERLRTNGSGIDVTGTVTADGLTIDGNVEIGSIETATNFPLIVKSGTNNHAIAIEEASGGETWQLGVDVDGDLGFYNSGSSTASVTFNDSGNVGIGTTDPAVALEVIGTDPNNNVSRVLNIKDDRSYAADVGGGISLFGKYNSGGSYSTFAQIIGAKTNGTDGDYSGYLSFKVRSASALPTEAMRINSSGNVGIGTTSPTATLDVDGTIKLDGNYPNGTNNVALGDGAFANASASNNVAIGHNASASVTTSNFNTVVGSLAFDAQTTGGRCTAIGYSALGSDTTGGRSTAVGWSALGNQNDTGSGLMGNTAIGYNPGGAITTGTYNVIIGYEAGTGGSAFTGSENHYIGYISGRYTTTGNYNIGLGGYTLNQLTTGSNNIAMGRSALGSQQTGDGNIAIGYNAMTSANGVTGNTVVGYQAGDALTSGNYNVAMGLDALGSTTTASNNVAIGVNAVRVNTTGTNNVGVGRNALEQNTTANNNTAVGYNAMYANTTGDANTAVGSLSLDANTTGFYNVAVGYAALSTVNQSYNTAVGYNALGAATSGQQNTGIGYFSLPVMTTALYNTAIGLQSGRDCTTGSDNVFVGYRAGDGPSPSGSITTQSNRIVMGNNSATHAYIRVSWTVTSDKRDKADIEPLTMGLDLVNKLEPITYKWDMRTDYEDGKPDGTHKKEKLHGGLLAQDVEKLEREYGYKVEDETSILTDKNADGNYGLQYDKFVPVLINAVKELSSQVDELKAEIQSLKGE